jgi:hypothetical protein
MGSGLKRLLHNERSPGGRGHQSRDCSSVLNKQSKGRAAAQAKARSRSVEIDSSCTDPFA